MSVDLSILIVNWNTRELLAGCLESVSGDAGSPVPRTLAPAHSAGVGERLPATGDQPPTPPPAPLPSLPPSPSLPLSLEVIVVDNASTDGSAAMLYARFPWVQVIENRQNVGFARANNQAICHSRGRYLLLLNSDTVVHPGALGTLVAFMDAHPRAGACGPRLLNGNGSLQTGCSPMLTPERELWRLSFLEHLWPRAEYPMARWDTTTPRPVEVIKGASLLLRRAAVDQVGLLDDRYFMYTEEVDLCYRLAAAGWGLWVVPAAVVTHFGGASSSQMAEAMFLQLYRSKLQFYRKFGGRARAGRFKAYLALAYAPRALAASLAAAGRPAWRPRARAYGRLLAELAGM